MSSLGSILDREGVYAGYLGEGDTYPYDLSALHIVNLSVVNDGTIDFTATVTYRNTDLGTEDIKVPVGYSMGLTTNEVTEIDVATGDSFTIALFKRGTV